MSLQTPYRESPTMNGLQTTARDAPPPPKTNEFLAFANMLRRRKWIVILVTLFGGVNAFIYATLQTNVYQHGTLIQDVKSENPEALSHGYTDLAPDAKRADLEHPAAFEPGSLVARLNGGPTGTINSSHHQAIDKPGKDLAVTAHAPDGTIEAVEWTGGPGWVVGVQWHPERMADDALAHALFTDFVAAAERARNARDLVGHKA